MKKLIPYLSPTGLTPTRESVKAAGLKDIQLPYRPEEIVGVIDNVQSVFARHYGKDTGLLVHTHIRTQEGEDTLSPKDFERLQSYVRMSAAASGSKKPGLIYTSSVPNTNMPVQLRALHILTAPMDKRPLGSTGLWGNFKFGRSDFTNSHDDMKRYAKALRDRKMLLENEVIIFAPDDPNTEIMIQNLERAIRDNVFVKPPYLNIVAGPAGMDYDYISRQAGHIKERVTNAFKATGMEGKPLIIIGGAIAPEDTVRLAVEHDLDGVRFGAGECRADAKCSWADNSVALTQRVIKAAKKAGVSFVTHEEMLNRFEEVGLSHASSHRSGGGKRF